MPYENNPSSFQASKILEAVKQEAVGSKTSVYLASTAITGLIYIGVSILLLNLITQPLLSYVYIPLSFLFALLFAPLRHGLEELIRQLMPGIDYNSFRIIKHLNTISYSSLTLDELSHRFFKDFQSYLSIDQSAFIFKNEHNYQIKTSPNFKNLTSLTHEHISLLFTHAINQVNYAKQCKHPQLKEVLSTHQIQVLIPLINDNQQVGLLLIGGKVDAQPFTSKDRKVMQRIAPKIAFAIKNAHQYETIQKQHLEALSAYKETAERLRKANRRLRHDDKLKDEFVYVTTHELKNPVTAMRGYVSLLLEGKYGPVPEAMRPAIEQIKDSNQQLVALLNNLLQIARSEAQTLDVRSIPVIICKTIDKVIHDVDAIAKQKGIAINHTCPNPAIKVMADEDRLNEIISNLVSNALKYSTTGTIEISHRIDQDYLVTMVKDQGRGISKDDQDKIFTRFFRGEDTAPQKVPGTGLGLFICKQLLEKMNGKIWFESEENVGSTFSFSLPLAKTYDLNID